MNATIALVLLSTSAPAPPCQPEWSEDFAGGDLGIGTGYAGALAEWVSQGRPRIFAGGTFLTADGLSANNIAQWDASRWEPLGVAPNDGVNNSVWSLKVYDDGSGEVLWVGGAFSKAGGKSVAFIARWDGEKWIPTPGMNANVNTFEVFNGALHAGGEFTKAGGVGVSRLARWNSVAWEAVPGIFDKGIYSLRAVDLGQGTRLYASGDLATIDRLLVNRIAVFDGTGWSALAGGFNGRVQDIQAATLQGETSLYVTGQFVLLGLPFVPHIAR